MCFVKSNRTETELDEPFETIVSIVHLGLHLLQIAVFLIANIFLEKLIFQSRTAIYPNHEYSVLTFIEFRINMSKNDVYAPQYLL